MENGNFLKVFPKGKKRQRTQKKHGFSQGKSGWQAVFFFVFARNDAFLKIIVCKIDKNAVFADKSLQMQAKGTEKGDPKEKNPLVKKRKAGSEKKKHPGRHRGTHRQRNTGKNAERKALRWEVQSQETRVIKRKALPIGSAK